MRTALFIVALAAAVPAFAGDAPQAVAGKSDADKDRLICRREIPIGSLIATRKICLTKAQWEQRATDGNREARKMVEDGASRQISN